MEFKEIILLSPSPQGRTLLRLFYIKESLLFMKNLRRVFIQYSPGSQTPVYCSVLSVTTLLLHQSPNVKLSNLNPPCCNVKPAFCSPAVIQPANYGSHSSGYELSTDVLTVVLLSPLD